MAFSPRAHEIAAVAAILESDDHDDARSMAGAIVRAVAAEISRRETYVVIPPGSPLAYGPYWTEKDAERGWTKDIGSAFDGPARLLRTFPWDPPVVELAACECGHAREQHVVPGPKNKPGKPSECGHYDRSKQRCECASFTPRRVA